MIVLGYLECGGDRVMIEEWQNGESTVVDVIDDLPQYIQYSVMVPVRYAECE